MPSVSKGQCPHPLGLLKAHPMDDGDAGQVGLLWPEGRSPPTGSLDPDPLTPTPSPTPPPTPGRASRPPHTGGGLAQLRLLPTV